MTDSENYDGTLMNTLTSSSAVHCYLFHTAVNLLCQLEASFIHLTL